MIFCWVIAPFPFFSINLKRLFANWSIINQRNNQLRPLDYVVYYIFLVGCLYFVSFLAIMAIPLTLWHSNFVKSFLSLISKKQNFQFFEKMFISRDIAFSVVFFRLNVCIFSIVATSFNLHLRNFGITSFMWLSKKGFLKFLKKKFLAKLLPFFFQTVSPVNYRT